MLSKLAFRNVKRQVSNYLIYFMTVSFTVAMLFALSNIIFSDNLAHFTKNNKALSNGLIGVVVFISAVIAFVLGYATSFMLKLRKREFGTYLTLGMSRKNILTIFISETTVICGFALALGLAIGLFLYQGLTAVMMNLMEMQFNLASYSPKGLALTVGLVIGIFSLASLASAIYLKKVSIYDLVQSNGSVKKEIKHPVIWFVITFVSLALLIGSLIYFNNSIRNIVSNGTSVGAFINSIMVFCVSIILFHISFARSVIYILLKNKKLGSKSTNTFVLRQLSGSLGSNSIMLGFLAALLSFAVICSNLSFVQKANQEEMLNKVYPYDILHTQNTMYPHNVDFEATGLSGNEGIPVEQAEASIKKYVDIKSQFSYDMYTSGSHEFYSQTQWSGEGFENLTDNFMKVSDFNALVKPLGLEEVKLTDEYVIVSNVPETQSTNWADFVYNQNGVSYSCKKVLDNYPRFSYVYFYVVIPDEAVENMESQIKYTAYDIEDGSYDASALKDELSYKTASDEGNGTFFYQRCDYSLREFGRQSENNINAILVIGALFVSAVFLFMVMAILALKTISTLSDDKRRYSILFRLGVSQQEQRKALFRQTFSFFVVPFAVPFFLSFPIVIISRTIMETSGMDKLIPQITIIVAMTAIVMTLVYFLYYTATYFIAKRTVIKDDF